MARLCTDPDEVAEALDAFGPPYVVKDDGLAAGKGVVVTQDRDEALVTTGNVSGIRRYRRGRAASAALLFLARLRR